MLFVVLGIVLGIVPLARHAKDELAAWLQFGSKLGELAVGVDYMLKGVVYDCDIGPPIRDLVERSNHWHTNRRTSGACGGVDLDAHSIATLEVGKQEAASAPKVENGIPRPNELLKLHQLGAAAELARRSLVIKVRSIIVACSIHGSIYRGARSPASHLSPSMANTASWACRKDHSRARSPAPFAVPVYQAQPQQPQSMGWTAASIWRSRDATPRSKANCSSRFLAQTSSTPVPTSIRARRTWHPWAALGGAAVGSEQHAESDGATIFHCAR